MIFAIKLSPSCQGIFDRQYLTNRDIVSVLKKHAKAYLKEDPLITFFRPDKLDKIDPLGDAGFLIWSDRSYKDTKRYMDWLNDFTNPFPFAGQKYVQAMAYSEPPVMKNDFDFEALGLRDILVDTYSSTAILATSYTQP